MAEINQLISAAQADWTEALPLLKEDSDIVSEHLPGSSCEQIDEAVKALAFFVGKARAPRGFKPVYDLSNALLARTASELQSHAANLKEQNWDCLPDFVQSLTKALSVVHTMVAFGDKDGTREVVTSLGAQMAEHIALLDTAKTELAAKSGQLEAASKLIDSFEVKASGIADIETETSKAKTDIKQYEVDAKASLDAAKLSQVAIADHQAKTAELLQSNTQLALSLQTAEKKLEEVQARSEKQQQFIESLMPRATDAGVSHAFGSRVAELNATKWWWFGVFMLALVGLSVMACYLVFGHNSTPGEQLWQHVLYRVPLAAPLVWLGWVAAVQYGNTIRLQEDYAFKEATSKAFVGYRDYFKTISSHAEDDEDPEDDPLKVLAAETIKITSKDPLRVLGRSADEASPAKSMLSGKPTSS